MIGTHIHLIKKLNAFTPRNVVEIGSRDANDAMQYASEFNIDPCNVIVFEPNPSLASTIRKQFPQIVVREEAIGREEGEATFHCVIPNGISSADQRMYEGMGSLMERVDNILDRSKMVDIPINVRKMHSIIRELNLFSIDICKVDAEGTTLSVLKSFERDLEKVKSFHLEMEYRSYWKGQDLAPAIKQFMTQHNFTLLCENYIGNSDQTDSVWVHNRFV